MKSHRGIAYGKNHPVLKSYKEAVITKLYQWLDGKEGLNIYLLDYPNFSVYRGKKVCR